MSFLTTNAAVAKLVYAQDLKSCGLNNRVGPIPAGGTPSLSYGVRSTIRGLAQLASVHGLGP